MRLASAASEVRTVTGEAEVTPKDTEPTDKRSHRFQPGGLVRYGGRYFLMTNFGRARRPADAAGMDCKSLDP